MGVPAFFRWISNKYPSIVSHCIEIKETRIGNEDAIVNQNYPNPNGIEIDYLYLDMNGIIHPCTHPQNKPAPETQAQMFEEITKYIDRILNIVRPRKLVYFAIDGVAPRAKMNQQRSRRFRASRDQKIHEEALTNMRDIVKRKGYVVPEVVEKVPFDSNCITPGTKFMSDLTEYLQEYISMKLKTAPAWQDLLIILSDSRVPGEGEHKIMDFIRKQRAKSTYDPNMVHCIYGADADLIMLGLSTHEPNFLIIREEFRPTTPNRQCPICMKFGHKPTECKGIEESEDLEKMPPDFIGLDEEFIFVRISVLREYLGRELNFPQDDKKLEFERIIDDWILLCFLVGNDFLPHLPSLEIREGALDTIVNIYRNRILKLDGYLSDNGILNLKNFKIILYDIGMIEDQIFKKRSLRQSQYLERTKSIESRDQNRTNEPWKRDKCEQNMNKAKSLDSLVPTPHNTTIDIDFKPLKRKFEERENEKIETPTAPSIPPKPFDPIRLGEDGWRARYYLNKLNIDESEIDSYRERVAREYLIGISWVLLYYYQGCVSWSWYYPFHYSPFASDCNLVESINVDWPKTFNPFRPFEQLMSVLPESSKYLLPVCYHDLMMSPKSPIVDFYPQNFVIDLNGKFQEWQGVALLPFIDEKRLLKFMAMNSKLSSEEKLLNSIGDNFLFLRESHNLGETILANAPLLGLGAYVSIGDLKYDNLFGEVLVLKSFQKSSSSVELVNEEENINITSPVVGVKYRDPVYPDDTVFQSKLLKGSKIPKPILKPTNHPRHQPYTPILNFPGSVEQPLRLTLPARRHFQHAMPHSSSSGYRQEGHSNHPHHHSGGRNSPEYRQRYNSREDPRINQYRRSDPKIIDYRHDDPRANDYRRDDRPFRPHYSNDPYSRRPSSHYDDASYDPRNHRNDNLPSDKRQPSYRRYDR